MYFCFPFFCSAGLQKHLTLGSKSVNFSLASKSVGLNPQVSAPPLTVSRCQNDTISEIIVRKLEMTPTCCFEIMGSMLMLTGFFWVERNLKRCGSLVFFGARKCLLGTFVL